AAGTEHVPVNHPIALLVAEDIAASSFETRLAAAPQDEGVVPSGAASSPSPHGGEGVHAVSATSDSASQRKGEGPLATEQVMHEIAAQIRRNGSNGHGARI